MQPAALQGNIIEETKKLTRDEGLRLRLLLWECRREVEREPQNLNARTALHQVLKDAGLVDEAREEAMASYGIARRLPALPAVSMVSLASMLAAGSYFSEAKEYLTKVLSRELSEAERVYAGTIGMIYAIHSGDLSWADQYLGEDVPAIQFIRSKNLAAWWPRQQARIQEVIGRYTASFGIDFASFEGQETLELTYYTNVELDRLFDLEGDVLNAIDDVYLDHPDGPGATLGLVSFNICGPRVPIPRGEQ